MCTVCLGSNKKDKSETSKDETKLIDKAILAPVEGTHATIHNHHVRDKQTPEPNTAQLKSGGYRLHMREEE